MNPSPPEAQPAPEPPTENNAPANATAINNSDLYFLGGIGLFTMIIVIAFGAMIVGTGLLKFPIYQPPSAPTHVSPNITTALETILIKTAETEGRPNAQPDSARTLEIIQALNDLEKTRTLTQITETHELNSEVLDYRERRMTLNLILRTFTITFSFLVGLVMCIYGGLFLIRRVESYTELGGSIGGSSEAPEAAPAAGGALASVGAVLTQPKKFSLKSYSPGIIFMLGGLSVIAWTQYATPPVTGPEIVPLNFRAFCASNAGVSWNDCTTDPATTARAKDPALQLNEIMNLSNRNIFLLETLLPLPFSAATLTEALEGKLNIEEKLRALPLTELNEAKLNHARLLDLRGQATTALTPQLLQILNQSDQANATLEVIPALQALDTAIWSYALNYVTLQKLSEDWAKVEEDFTKISADYTDYQASLAAYTEAQDKEETVYQDLLGVYERIREPSQVEAFTRAQMSYNESVLRYNSAHDAFLKSLQPIEKESENLKRALENLRTTFPNAASGLRPLEDRFERAESVKTHAALVSGQPAFTAKTPFAPFTLEAPSLPQP